MITQDRNAPEETGSLAKAASGALETMPLLRAVNIARTLIALKAANVWCVGLDAAGKPLSGPAFAGRRVALVLGAEGEGLRRLTRETCDEIAGLSIKGAVESLNVSAAAAVALYELTRRGMSFDPEPAAAALRRDPPGRGSGAAAAGRRSRRGPRPRAPRRNSRWRGWSARCRAPASRSARPANGCRSISA